MNYTIYLLAIFVELVRNRSHPFLSRGNTRESKSHNLHTSKNGLADVSNQPGECHYCDTCAPPCLRRNPPLTTLPLYPRAILLRRARAWFHITLSPPDPRALMDEKSICPMKPLVSLPQLVNIHMKNLASFHTHTCKRSVVAEASHLYLALRLNLIVPSRHSRTRNMDYARVRFS